MSGLLLSSRRPAGGCGGAGSEGGQWPAPGGWVLACVGSRWLQVDRDTFWMHRGAWSLADCLGHPRPIGCVCVCVCVCVFVCVFVYSQSDPVGQPRFQQSSCMQPIQCVFWVGRQSKSLADFGFWQRFVNICAAHLRSVDSKGLATLALLGAFGAFQVLLAYRTDLTAPD